jgi:hypothetical protein
MKNARKSDPCTSHTSAQRDRGTLIVQAAKLVRKHPGLTFQQLYRKHLVESSRYRRAATFASPESLMKRLSDGERRGLLIPACPVKCPITGHKARTWHAR